MKTKSLSTLAALCSCCLFAHSTVARSWVEVPGPSPAPGATEGIAAVTDTDVWSVGFGLQNGFNAALTQHWDGTSWNTVPAQLPSDPYSFLFGVIALNSQNVWTVGYSLDDAGVVFSNLIEHWDGVSWQIVPSPNVQLASNTLYAISAISPNDIWAVGYTDTTGGPHHFLPLALHWDGTAWTIVPTPTTAGGLLLAVKAFATDDVWAVGERQAQSSHTITSTTYILHWNGTTWRVVQSPNNAVAVNALLGVSGAASNDVWAVGLTGDSFSDNGALALHWDGLEWTIVPPAATSGADPLYAVVAISSRNVMAVGSIDGAPLAERWNGNTWSVVPTPTAESPAGLVAISAGGKGSLWASGYQASGELFLKAAR